MTEQDEKIIVKIDSDLEEIIPEYLELTKNDIDSMLGALDKGDYETVRKLGHNLKGSGSGYGFDLVTEIGAKIEQLAKTNAGDEIRTLVDELSEYFKRVSIIYE